MAPTASIVIGAIFQQFCNHPAQKRSVNVAIKLICGSRYSLAVWRGKEVKTLQISSCLAHTMVSCWICRRWRGCHVQKMSFKCPDRTHTQTSHFSVFVCAQKAGEFKSAREGCYRTSGDWLMFSSSSCNISLWFTKGPNTFGSLRLFSSFSPQPGHHLIRGTRYDM